ncbi:hypothetical protein SAMN04488109_0025 [Chryseolinea serpens]|uniref:DUF2199 domain-containing protein n=1 Tax=Chryseolinea serpens TaxID=947013 RepID=A0A1M5JES4_9BACT|nr:DUF2199 domain-containing protein [Chryseolinea serpens]SHG39057.1 hypothetical protein SAMN04488109_0025 [Chryseolinea serpens]
MTLIKKKTWGRTVYQCSCCGRTYDEAPLTFGSDRPDYYHSVPPDERPQRISLAESLCVVDEQHFFHCGRLTIPIIDHHQNLIFNVWTSISEDNFRKRNQLWNNPERVNEGPYFGWMQTTVPTYGNTINIKAVATENEVGLIPSIQVIEEEHPLAIDQQNGIIFEKALQIAGSILANEHPREDGSK